MAGWCFVKGEIVAIKELFNEDGTTNCYEVIIDFNNDKPPFRLGTCEVKQDEKV